MLAAGAAALAASRPVAVAAAIAAVENAVTCNSPSPCATWSNSGKGPGASASSAKGDGLYGNTTSGWSGVYGTTSNGLYGVFGTNQSSSTEAVGVYGKTASGNGLGVVGYATGDGVGTYGFSQSGYGLEGLTFEGYGVVAEAFDEGNGIYVSASGSGYGISSYTNGGLAIFASNSNGIGSDLEGSYIGIVGRAPASGGYPMVLTDSNENDVFYVDGTGNVYYAGGLISYARVKGGGNIRSFSTKTTLPTVEDTGTAELVNGMAQVRLDPTFAASIDAKTGYRVFVTPDGETRGWLFVAAKNSSGFTVREAQAGRSTVTFDYRIVATALGQAGQRMAFVNANGPRAAIPVAPRLNLAKPKGPAKS